MKQVILFGIGVMLLVGCLQEPAALPTAVSVAELPAGGEPAPVETAVVVEPTAVAEEADAGAVEDAAPEMIEDEAQETAVPTKEPTPIPTSEPTPLPLPGQELFSFTSGEPAWYTVDDDVMGGVSSSTVSLLEPNILFFSGNMSLENNGGFSSVRSNWQLVDLSDADGVLLRVLGDGLDYRLRIRTDSVGREISYNALFNTEAGEWRLVYIPFDGMVPTYRGFVMDVGPLDASTVGSFGLMLSDKQPGAFELQVDWMRAVSEEELAVFAASITN